MLLTWWAYQTYAVYKGAGVCQADLFKYSFLSELLDYILLLAKILALIEQFS